MANAGIGGENTYGEKDRWREVIETNLTGTYQTLQECLPYLKKDEAPFKKVVILSSILARLGVPGYSAYCASKGGVRMLTKAAAVELAPHNIRVCAIGPGVAETPLTESLLENPSALNEQLTRIPMGRLGQPSDIADLATFLASDDASYVTGVTVMVDGGELTH